MKQMDKQLEIARKRKKLTIRQQRFVNNLLADPTNLAKAARLAGYSARSDKYAGHRLIRNEAIRDILRHHFVDKQTAADELLVNAIQWAGSVLDDPDAAQRDKAKAAKWVVDYTRLAVGVLGLTLPAKSKPFPDEDISAEELIRMHKLEIEQLERVRDAEHKRAHGGADSESPAPEGAADEKKEGVH